MLGSTIIEYIFLLFIDNFKVGFPGGSDAMQETQVQSLGQEDPLEKETVTHSSILAWKIPQTEKPGGLQCMGSQSQT